MASIKLTMDAINYQLLLALLRYYAGKLDNEQLTAIFKSCGYKTKDLSQQIQYIAEHLSVVIQE